MNLRTRVIDLVGGRGASDGDVQVPHCPAWSVRDLVAHMVGVPEDILAGRLEGVTTEAWTQAQVVRHAGESLADLASVWEQTAAAFDAVLPLIPEPTNSQLVLDAVTHEHDLRFALGEPGAQDDVAVGVAIGWILHTAERVSPGAAGELRAYGLDDFELLRVCTGRRSRREMASLGVDVARIEAMLANGPLSIPADPASGN